MRTMIWGASKHAKYTIDIMEQAGTHEPVFLYDPTQKGGWEIYGYPVYGKESILADLIQQFKIEGAIVAIGDNYIRKSETERLLAIVPEIVLVNSIHPSLHFSKYSTLGKGIVIMAGVAISNDVVIGDGCFLATNSSIDHDSILEDFVSVSANGCVGGSCHIGECTAIALGVNVIHGIEIGQHSVVGAGSVVVKNLPDNVVAYGIPSKVIRARKRGEKYL